MRGISVLKEKPGGIAVLKFHSAVFGILRTLKGTAKSHIRRKNLELPDINTGKEVEMKIRLMY